MLWARAGGVSLETAVHRITGQAAAHLGLERRGLLQEGMYADVVLLNLGELASPADWSNPSLSPVGVRHVVVNGMPVFEAGAPTGRLPGRFLRPDGAGVQERRKTE